MQAALLPQAFQLSPLSRSPLEDSLAGPARSYGEELPDMLLSYLVRKTNALSDEWDKVRSKIRTADEVEARNRFVREKCKEMIHGYPERNPLNSTVVKVLERDGYRIENVMFQSRPDFWVTGNLYIPTSGPGPFPGIISPSGHYPAARIYAEYQFAYLNFVKNGFVVLAYDPIGQGERRQFWNPETNENELGGPVTWEHSLPGQQLLLLGEDLTHYRVWDGMRAIDYLLTRPEVDTKRIGCAGHSGGGTLTKFISALDKRVQCAVINEGGTSNRWPLDIAPDAPLGTGDTEQHLFPAAIYGIDHVDLHMAIAPRPLLVTIEKYSSRFTRAAQAILARYRQLGVPEKFATVEAGDPHAWTVKLRLANTDWFTRWFYNRRGPESEPEFTPEPAENLYCTVNGSIRTSQKGQTIFSVILKNQSDLPPRRRVPTNRAEFETFRSQMGSEIRSLWRHGKFDQPLGVRHIATTPRKRYRIEQVEFLSEPGIYISAWVFVPEAARTSPPAILYVSEAGKEADGMELGILEGMALASQLVVAVDVRGVGATKPPHLAEEHQGKFRQLDDVETVLTYMAWEMDACLFGMRVGDVIRSVDYVFSRSDVDPGSVRVIGKGTGALWSLYAAALDSRIQAVVCDNGLLSYHSLTSVDRYLHEASIFIRGVMRHFDLPQVAAAVAGRRLALLSPVDGMKAPVEFLSARRAYEWTQAVYANLGVRDHFRVSRKNPDATPAEQYLDLLGVA